MLISENRWRAQRYGIEKGLVDFGKSKLVSYEKLIDELIELVKEDAKELNCENELKKIKSICKSGTSADKQVKIFKEEMKKTNNNKRISLDKVIKFLMKETMNF